MPFVPAKIQLFMQNNKIFPTKRYENSLFFIPLQTMKILLIGEYSNLHATLAEGLRHLGHSVTVVSDGNKWRNYPRDINLDRKSTSTIGGILYLLRLVSLLPRLRGYDVVQLINPDFLQLKSERQRWFYYFLRRHNKRLFIGAFGSDWYWVDAGLHKKLLRYGDFYIGTHTRADEPQTQAFINEWINTPKGDYCREIMNDCDGIPACLYEYQVCYSDYFPQKTKFIPLPIIACHDKPVHLFDGQRIRFFIGIDKARSQYKGTDIMFQALQHVASQHPAECEIVKVESLPYAEYMKSMDNCDVMLDQLYSYTPSMNSLLAMSKGIIVVGGGEPENYEIIQEQSLRPIINVEPTFESVCQQLEWLITHQESIEQLKADSIAYVKKHHDYIKVAQCYADMFESTRLI